MLREVGHVSNGGAPDLAPLGWRCVIMKIICTLGLFVTCLVVAFLLGLATGIGVLAHRPSQQAPVSAVAIDVRGTAQM